MIELLAVAIAWFLVSLGFCGLYAAARALHRYVVRRWSL